MTADMPATPSNRQAARRLAFLLLWLILFDQFIPAILPILETRRYEGSAALRFENSDLFGLGPIVSYLRENPHRNRRRAVFLGNSMMFGFGLRAEDALPAQFEQQRPGTHSFNMAVNGHELGTSYLVAKAIIDSVDVVFVQVSGEHANPSVASLIPIDNADVRAFGLKQPDPLEQWLKEKAGHVWHLYGFNERIQAAIFGTSTREYLYLHKREILMALLRRRPALPPSPPLVAERPFLVLPPANRAPFSNHRLNSQEVLVQRFAELGRSHHKRVVFLEFEYASTPNLIANFDPANVPTAEVTIIHVPAALTFDGQHLTAQGSRLVSELLARYDAQHASGETGK